MSVNQVEVSIDLFRGACAVKGNVQVAGHVKPAPFSRRDVTLGDVDGSLFHIKIWFFIGHHDQHGHTWGNISQFAMWLSQSSVYIYKSDQSTYQIQHLAARFDSAMNKWTLPHLLVASFFYHTHRPHKYIAVILSNIRKHWKVHIRKQQHLILPVNTKKCQLMQT